MSGNEGSLDFCRADPFWDERANGNGGMEGRMAYAGTGAGAGAGAGVGVDACAGA